MENQLSIIIPCYNVAEYLPVTLDSILSRQNFSSLEIILIDDGSTDNTLNVIRRYKEEYDDIIRYFSIGNSGVSFARNLGLKQATGEYILFIDGDDMLFDDILPLWMENIYRNRLDVSLSDMKNAIGERITDLKRTEMIWKVFIPGKKF